MHFIHDYHAVRGEQRIFEQLFQQGFVCRELELGHPLQELSW